jgi:hypothetical protein
MAATPAVLQGTVTSFECSACTNVRIPWTSCAAFALAVRARMLPVQSASTEGKAAS